MQQHLLHTNETNQPRAKQKKYYNVSNHWYDKNLKFNGCAPNINNFLCRFLEHFQRNAIGQANSKGKKWRQSPACQLNFTMRAVQHRYWQTSWKIPAMRTWQSHQKKSSSLVLKTTSTSLADSAKIFWYCQQISESGNSFPTVSRVLRHFCFSAVTKIFWKFEFFFKTVVIILWGFFWEYPRLLSPVLTTYLPFLAGNYTRQSSRLVKLQHASCYL